MQNFPVFYIFLNGSWRSVPFRTHGSAMLFKTKCAERGRLLHYLRKGWEGYMMPEFRRYNLSRASIAQWGRTRDRLIGMLENTKKYTLIPIRTYRPDAPPVWPEDYRFSEEDRLVGLRPSLFHNFTRMKGHPTYNDPYVMEQYRQGLAEVARRRAKMRQGAQWPFN